MKPCNTCLHNKTGFCNCCCYNYNSQYFQIRVNFCSESCDFLLTPNNINPDCTRIPAVCAMPTAHGINYYPLKYNSEHKHYEKHSKCKYK